MEQMELPMASLRAARRLNEADLVYKKDLNRAQDILARLERRNVPVAELADHIARGNFHYDNIVSAPALSNSDNPETRRLLTDLSALLQNTHVEKLDKNYFGIKGPGGQRYKVNRNLVEQRLRETIDRRLSGVRREFHTLPIAAQLRDEALQDMSSLIFRVGITPESIYDGSALQLVRRGGRVGSGRVSQTLNHLAEAIARRGGLITGKMPTTEALEKIRAGLRRPETRRRRQGI